MKSLSIALGAVLAVALAAAAYVINRPAVPAPGAATADTSRHLGESRELDNRISALETALAEERSARQALEDELQAMKAEIATTGSGREMVAAVNDAAGDSAPEAANAAAFFATRRASRESDADRAQRLTAAGFAPDRAAWIVQRESELQFEAMQARFDAARSGEQGNPFDDRWNPDAMLRAEIGDREYEQYLQANGRPTAVAVGEVLQSSAGQIAGLQPGDEIVSYDGQRVFSAFDLNRQTMQGEPGQSVVVDILRDDAPMQLVMPRGPIGISARGRGRMRP